MQTSWFGGAKWNVEGDQTERFLKEGIWQNGFKDKLLDVVASVNPGDAIAIKATYTRLNGLPFNNQQKWISTMSIKAIGVVRHNCGDGRTLEVDWEHRFATPREWYFFVYQPTLWRVQPTDWRRKDLIRWAFLNGVQDYDKFASEYLCGGK